MSISLGQKSYLDILHSQTEMGGVVNHIPIRKIRFEDIAKPTDLAPLREEVLEANEVSNSDLQVLRSEYAKELAPFLKSVKSKKITFAKMMQGFGTNKEMPKVSEPHELVKIKEEYLNTKNKIVGTDKLLQEVNLLRDEIALASSFQKIYEKGNKSWNRVKSLENTNVSVALLSDINVLPNTSVPNVPTNEELTAKNIEVVSKIPEIKAENDTTLLFDNKELKITRSKDTFHQDVTVFYDNVEIAKGMLTSKGPSIKVYPRYKAGFLLAPTTEEKAFAKALTIIKSFKL